MARTDGWEPIEPPPPSEPSLNGGDDTARWLTHAVTAGVVGSIALALSGHWTAAAVVLGLTAGPALAEYVCVSKRGANR